MSDPSPSPRRFAYPCTGRVEMAGFDAFLKENLGPSRANLQGFADELGSRFSARHISLVNSGSSANLAAAMALFESTGPGEAIVAGFGFPTTLHSLTSAGYSLRFVDTAPGGFHLHPDALQRAIGPDTKVVCYTHFLGFPGQIGPVRNICDAHGLMLLQDACESQHLLADGRPVHELGDLTTWSFYHPHHISSFGGGAVLSTDADMRQRVESITHWGRACTCHYDRARCPAPEGMFHNFHYVRVGHNLEMSELNACFGRFQLRSWEDFERRRKSHYRTYVAALSGLSTVRIYDGPADNGSPFVFPITVLEGEVPTLARQLAARGVEIRSLMGGVLADQPAFRGVARGDLTTCTSLAKRSFFVGIHQTLSPEAVHTTARILHDVLS